MKPTCFVIQPFDGGRYDKRYNDVYEPAIRAAGLEPYRVDKDPHVEIPIRDIEEGIRAAEICFAEITIDNPNVWFELGYAISAQKPVVLVCARERERFPFDVQHRIIIRYDTDSASDFLQLKNELIQRLKGTLDRQREISTVANLKAVASGSHGLSQAEIATLVLIATHEKLNSYAMSGYKIRREMDQAGFTDAACAMSLRSLEIKLLIRAEIVTDTNEEYLGYNPTEKGWRWLDENQEQIQVRKNPTSFRNDEDDLPF